MDEKRFIKKEVLGVIPVLVSIAFAIGFAFNYEPDPYAELAVILASISIGLSLGIFVIQQIQGNKLQDVVDEVHTATVERNTLLNDKREVFADEIIRWWLSFEFDYEHTFDIHQRFILDHEGTDEQANNTRNNIIELFKTNLQKRRPPITSMEMVEVFGKKLANPWNHLIFQSSIDSSIHLLREEEFGLKLLLTHYQKCFNLLTTMKDELIQYASNPMKTTVSERLSEMEERKKKQ